MREHPWLRGRKLPGIEVVENGIPFAEASRPAARRQDVLEFCRQRVTIGAVGRLSREKGFDVLLDACAGLVAEGRDIRLAILGEGGRRAELEARAMALGMTDRFLLPGYVDGAGSYLQHFNLFALPSLTEGLPMVLLEAMRAGVPVVATRVGGIPDAFDLGKAGLLVTPGEVPSLKAGIAEILDLPAAARRRADEAAHRVRTIYSSEAMAARYLKIYQEVLQGSAEHTAELEGGPA
jgi:glycosyltransferase involved in cell wall biosynthesis